MQLRSQIGHEVQQARDGIPAQQDLGQPQRGRSEDEQQPHNQEERHVLKIVVLDAPYALYIVIDSAG